MEVIDLVNRFVGEIEPIGDESVDEIRYENLKIYCDLTLDMCERLKYLADKHANSDLDSVKKSVTYINDILNSIKTNYNV